MLKLTVCNLSLISFRFTLSLFLVFFFLGGGGVISNIKD